MGKVRHQFLKKKIDKVKRVKFKMHNDDNNCGYHHFVKFLTKLL